jgi:lipid-binding SYLF domain-containing protein
MRHVLYVLLGSALLLAGAVSWADDYTDTVALFKNAGESGGFFQNCYGYAVFPGIGKGGFVVGGAHGNGRVYVHGQYVGDTSMTQLSVGFQAGGEAYSQIIFFRDRRAFEEFSNGTFEFGADANAVAITAAAGASVGTSGANADVSGGMKDARTVGKYYRGFAVFTIVRGGAMYQVTLAGQKFSYTPRT